MKTYEEVVRERYDGRERNINLYDNIYSIINPIGFNGHVILANAVYKIFNYLLNRNIDLTSIKILDVGCGSGSITRLFAEFTGNPSNIVGIDLSKYRIETARSFSQSIQYLNGNIVTGYEFNDKFDLITAFDVFMHLNTEEEINKALTNISQTLNSDGIFVWYDAYAANHFDCPADSECNGFSSKQMEDFARQAGFKKIHEFSLYKNFLGKRHSLYLYNKLPVILVKVLEKVIPGNPGNMVKLFAK